MKNVKRFLFLLVGLGLLFSCNKSDREGFADIGLQTSGLKAGRLEVVVVVEPNGTDDTDNLLNAFAEAMSYEPDATVQLVAGDYHLNFIEIREFNGTFMGAGKGKTVITTVADLNVNALISQNLNTVLIRFVGGEIHMGDMTIKTPPGALSTGSEDWIDGLVGFSSITAQYASENEYINALINDVDFAGHWENTAQGLKAESGFRNTIPGGIPLSSIDISVTNCSFDGFNLYGALIQQIKKGRITVGIKNNGNHFDNIYYASIGLWFNVNVEMYVEGNKFVNPAGTRFGMELFSSPYPGFNEQVLQTKVTVCNIEQNVFNITGGTGGMLINDRRRYFYPDDKPMLVQVKNNLFNMSNNAMTGIGCFNMSGMVIRNNRFEGSGQYGVRIMGPSPYPYNENGLMLGNNFSNTTYSFTTVLLDKRTSNWTIVGGNLGDYIANNGENNIITGFNNSTSVVPLGQTIVDNLEEIREAAHLWKDH